MAIPDVVIDLAIRYGFQVLGAIVILVAGWIAGAALGRFADRRLADRMEPPLRLLVVRVLRLLVFLLAGVVALDKFGFQIAPLVAGIGVAGIGIGIALQGVLSNVMAGLTIIMTKPFRVGEHIAVVGVEGDVSAIELFSTTLVHPDRSRVIIPNRRIIGEILHNYGTMRQLDLAVTVPHGSDLAVLLPLAGEVARANARVLKDPAPVIGIGHVGDSGIRVSVRPWVRVPDYVTAQAELYETLLARFTAAGVGVPAPHHEVRLVNGGALR